MKEYTEKETMGLSLAYARNFGFLHKIAKKSGIQQDKLERFALQEVEDMADWELKLLKELESKGLK